jgi:hypothetical protein
MGYTLLSFFVLLFLIEIIFQIYKWYNRFFETTYHKGLQIVLLKTDKYANIIQRNNVLFESDRSVVPNVLYSSAKLMDTDKYWEAVNLYVLSNDEIKVGDWYMTTEDTFHKLGPLGLPHYVGGKDGVNRKIVASTNKNLNVKRLSHQFIRDFCIQNNDDISSKTKN